MNRTKTQRGITLIETILYLAVAVFVMGAFFSYGWDITQTNVKFSIAAQTARSAEDIEQRITYEIRRAQRVRDIAASRVVLQESDGDVSIEFSNNTITVKRGSDSEVALNSNDINISNFVFTHQDSDTNDPQYIGFSCDVAAAYPGSTSQNAYTYSLPVQSGASLRTY